MSDGKLTFIDEIELTNKKILLRADFDVSLNPDFTIDDDFRIRQNLPTIKFLLGNKNRLICVAKLGRPKERNPQYSLKIVAERLKQYLPSYKIKLIDDFLTDTGQVQIDSQAENEILVLENIRFYPQEKANDQQFAQKLAALADTYVEDAFAMCHRYEASIIGIPQYLPAYGGLLLKKEIAMISKATSNPQRPLVAIIGGIKLETKLGVVNRFLSLADYVLVGSGLIRSVSKDTKIIIPSDAVLDNGRVKVIPDLMVEDKIMDIGPQAQAEFSLIIAQAKTIVWNGPMGYFEDVRFRKGTDAVYEAIINNQNAVSIVGGGNTLAAIAKKNNLDKITHLSTGGGAMLTFIEKGTLPGIEALRK